MNITLNRTVDLSSTILPEVLQAPLYEGEKNAHTFVISAVKNKLPHPLSGSVVAYFDRADGNTVRVEGEIIDGTANVTLPAECYQTGVFYLAIMIVSENAQTAIYAASGRVKSTQEGEIINGGSGEGGTNTKLMPYYINIVSTGNGTSDYKTTDDFVYDEMVSACESGRPAYIARTASSGSTKIHAILNALYDEYALFLNWSGLIIETITVRKRFNAKGNNVTIKGQRVVGMVNNVQPEASSYLGGITLTAADIPGVVRSVNGENPDENGNVEIGQGTYTLPTMSESTKGGAKVGAGLKMVGDALTVDGASTENAGKLLFVNENGTLSPLSLGTGLKIVNGVLAVTTTITPDEPEQPDKPDEIIPIIDETGDFTIEGYAATNTDGDITIPGLTETLSDTGNLTLEKEAAA